jgi:hypothetical protein
VATLARTGLFLVVTPSLPAANLKEFIALAKSEAGQLNSAAPGGRSTSSRPRCSTALAGVKLVHIPYKGSAPAVADVMAGQAQLSFQTPATVLGNVKGGKLRALAISGETPFADPKGADVRAGGLRVSTWSCGSGCSRRPARRSDRRRLNAEVARSSRARTSARRSRRRAWRSGLDAEQYGAAPRRRVGENSRASSRPPASSRSDAASARTSPTSRV